MLVLSRFLREKVIIKTSQGDIVISVQEVHGPKVKLGFEAPKEVQIIRSELDVPGQEWTRKP